jgi:hypothetical protein
MGRSIARGRGEIKRVFEECSSVFGICAKAQTARNALDCAQNEEPALIPVVYNLA